MRKIFIIVFSIVVFVQNIEPKDSSSVFINRQVLFIDTLMTIPFKKTLLENIDSSLLKSSMLYYPDFVIDPDDNIFLIFHLISNANLIYKYDKRANLIFKKELKHVTITTCYYDTYLYVFDGFTLYMYNPNTMEIVDKTEFQFLKNNPINIAGASTTFYSHFLMIGKPFSIIKGKDLSPPSSSVLFIYDLISKKVGDIGDLFLKEKIRVPQCSNCDSIENLLNNPTSTTKYHLLAQSEKYVLYEKNVFQEEFNFSNIVSSYFILDKKTSRVQRLENLENEKLVGPNQLSLIKFNDDSTMVYQTKGKSNELLRYYRIRIRIDGNKVTDKMPGQK